MALLGLLIATVGFGLFFVWLLTKMDGKGRFVVLGPRLLPFVGIGAVAIFPGLFFYAVAAWISAPSQDGRWAEILFVWTVNAPVEEFAKYLSFALLSAVLRSIREPQDGSLQGAATGLGFALGENLLYGLEGGWELYLLRTVFSLPGHVIYGAVWGGYHGFEVYQGRGRVRRWSIPMLALIPAAFSHGLFNTLVIVQAPLLWALMADCLTLSFGVYLFLRLRSYSPHRMRRPLREWSLAIPELQHALALQPRSVVLRRRLSAYLLVADRPEEALAVLAELKDDPWTRFYRDAAVARKQRTPTAIPESASLAPQLFRTLSGG